MALKTETEYEDIFGDHLALLLGLDEETRNTFVRPMKQADGTRLARRLGNFLVGFTPNTDWIAYHVMFDDEFEEPYTLPDQSKIIAKRYVRVEYNFVGPNSANRLMTFKSMLYTLASSSKLISDKIVYQNIEQNTIDSDELINGQWYNRRVIAIKYLEEVEMDNPNGPVELVDNLEINVEKIE